jgi:SAM-dependent methyltransferase
MEPAMNNAPHGDRWWETLYDDTLADVLLERDDPRETERTIAFLVSVLALRAGDTVLDQCCGIGSLAVPLAARGLRVIGVDQCVAYVERGRRAAAEANVDARFVAADAFTFVPDVRCDAAFNWWTSFGYADSDAENARMLARAFDALRPGGAFALDTLNVAGILRDFKAQVVTRRTTARGEIELVRDSAIDLVRARMRKTWTFTSPSGTTCARHTSVRLYMPHEIGAILAQVGFTDVRFFGSVSGDDLALDSPRCIAVARRPT